MTPVTFELKFHERQPHFTYCDIRDAQGELLVSATLDYCIDVASSRNYQIVNAQQVLTSLHKSGTQFRFRP